MSATFTASKIAEIRIRLRELHKPSTTPSRKKTLRGQLRDKFGFRITDYTDNTDGFVESDLDDLIRRGTITVVDD